MLTEAPSPSARLAPPTSPVRGVPIAIGKHVLLPRDARLPDRCVKCNAPAEGFRKRCNLSWHSPVLYLLILLGLIFYVIIALCVRRTAKVEVGLCPRHRARRKLGITIGLILLTAAIATPFIAAAIDNGVPILFGVLAFVASLVVLIVANQVVTPARIEPDGSVLLRGCGRAFRESLS